MTFDYYASQLKPIGCGSCRNTSEKLRGCTACKCISYCNVECQRRHWRQSHKRECKPMKANKQRWEELAAMDLADPECGATGLFILGVRLGVGDEQAPMEPELACKLYEAATQMQSPIPGGHPVAMLHLALHYERGIGVPQSHEKAYQYYKAVTEHPRPGEDTVNPAFLALSRFHRDGLGGAQKSMDLAIKFYTFSQSNAEEADEIQHLEQWWISSGGVSNVPDGTKEEVINLEP
ncbi:hypothetical protein ACHAWF_004594 [Thalassiosira exigua]